MKVYCTRPRQPDEAPHWNEMAVDDLFGTDKSLTVIPDWHCQQCAMPLILKGRYVPLQELGQGSFGRTFLALDREFFDPDKLLKEQSQRVIKQFRSDRRLLPEQMAQAERAFQREKNILNQLSHAGIPRIYSYFKLSVGESRQRSQSVDKQEFHYIVQEYIQGQDLQKELEYRLSANDPFTEAEVRVILQQILAVLAYLHTQPEPVIHRDIKPSNIVHAQASNTYYLIDFGAVRQIIPMIEQGLASDETHFVTPGFSPPEQYERQVDFSSDLYALAKTCICLLTGSAFNHQSWQQVARVSPQLAQILERMSDADPQRRYRSAQAVQQALENEGTTAAPSSATILATAPATIPAAMLTPILNYLVMRSALMQRWKWLGGAGAIGLFALVLGLSKSWLPGLITLPPTRWEPPVPSPAPVLKLPPQPNLISSVSNVPSGEVRYGGSTTWLKLSSKVNPVIRQVFPHLRLQTVPPPPGQWWHSEAGIAMLIEGKVDFALSSKGIPDELQQQAQAKGVKLKKIPVAISSSVVAVHPSLPIAGITLDQVDRIKQGQVTNWQDLGGSDLPITIYSMDQLYVTGAKFQKVANATAALQRVATDPGGVHIAPSSIAVDQCQVKALSVGVDLAHVVSPYEQPIASPTDCLKGRKNRVNTNVIQNFAYLLTVELTVIVLDDGGFKQRAGEAYAKMVHTAQGQTITRQAGYLPIDEMKTSP